MRVVDRSIAPPPPLHLLPLRPRLNSSGDGSCILLFPSLIEDEGNVCGRPAKNNNTVPSAEGSAEEAATRNVSVIAACFPTAQVSASQPLVTRYYI